MCCNIKKKEKNVWPFVISYHYNRAVYLKHKDYFKLAAAGVILNWQNEIL